jgi:hypothetical protein
MFANQPMPADPAIAKAAVVLRHMRKERFSWYDSNMGGDTEHEQTVSIHGSYRMMDFEVRMNDNPVLTSSCMIDTEADMAAAVLSCRELSPGVVWLVLEELRLGLLQHPEKFFTPDEGSEKVPLEVTEDSITMNRKLAGEMFSLLRLNALDKKG